MGNIVNDIVDDVEIKPKNNKVILKVVVSISITLITIAFLVGQFKSSMTNRLDVVEIKADKNTTNIEQHKVFDDWRFHEYQTHYDKQFILFIDYGINDDNINKELIKRTLELNSSHLNNTIDEVNNHKK